MAVAAAVSLANTAGQLLGGILNAHPKDKERGARNVTAYNKAANGDENALKFLLYRSGRASVVNGYVAYDGSYMGSLGSQNPQRIAVEGWPTATTRDDAKRKYDAAIKARQVIKGTGTTQDYSNNFGDDPVGAALPPDTYPDIASGIMVTAAKSPLLWLGLAVAGAVAYKYLK